MCMLFCFRFFFCSMRATDELVCPAKAYRIHTTHTIHRGWRGSVPLSNSRLPPANARVPPPVVLVRLLLAQSLKEPQAQRLASLLGRDRRWPDLVSGCPSLPPPGLEGNLAGDSLPRSVVE